MQLGRMPMAALVTSALLACGLVPAPSARGHETDQYSVPVGREFAELGPYFDAAFRDVLEQTVRGLNSQIRRTLRDGQPTDSTEAYYQQATVAATTYHGTPMWANWVEPVESRLLSPAVRRRYPGLVTVYQPASWVYNHWALVLDPTKLPRLVRCGTVMSNGVYFGTDKLMHFSHVGFHYYQEFSRARRRGADADAAMQAAVDLGTGPHPFLSEATWLGLMSTGVWSNADLAVNYVGLLFYRNLTEPIELGGRTWPPLLVRKGAYWHFGPELARDGWVFSRYVTDHWDEVLNPNRYGPGIGPLVKRGVAKRCDETVAWYRLRHPRIRSAAGFRALAEELTTIDGNDYGHRGDLDTLVTLANVCSFNGPSSGTVDPSGKTELWWAAHAGDANAVRTLLAGGAAPGRADVDGETPLHAAARAGHPAAVELLLQSGADPNAINALSATPLHAAARAGHVEIAAALVAAGANAEAIDLFGCTPLWHAARGGHAAIVQSLTARSPTVAARASHAGSTPRQQAERGGHEDIAGLLPESQLAAN
jgi:hypothetical protein